MKLSPLLLALCAATALADSVFTYSSIVFFSQDKDSKCSSSLKLFHNSSRCNSHLSNRSHRGSSSYHAFAGAAAVEAGLAAEAAAEAARIEAWEESDDYYTALAEWACGDPDVQQAFTATAAYTTALEAWIEAGQ
jgi:V8-like Glu-specific endopeptidase